ncbi:MAG: Proline--tRNA ligase [Parcubacteria group bacterium ADurb.Bin247]|nr:MAG: Proline--tRNA ligase [Parcubacteria group bacterium ADurb.Bin247]
MRITKLFSKTRKDSPKDETSKNAQLLIKSGYIHKELAGVYTYLPLGLRVINKISNIIREEMDNAGGQEILMTVLQDKNIWEKSKRWDDNAVDDWFKTRLKNNTELGLGFTHEEPLVNLMKNHISSYKDLPIYPYQIQTKFRNELRAKSGIMRGREFLMKDMYSFSKNKEEHNLFYEKMKEVYMSIFNQLGLGDKTYTTISSGGSFSKYSYEFQTVSDAGEDIIYIIDQEKKLAINEDDFNEETLKDFGLNLNKETLRSEKSIEVGDIYSLGYRYSKALNLKYTNEKGLDEFVYMGCYGIGISRLMGAIVELNSDDKGLVWPREVSPFDIHLISLSKTEDYANKIYDELVKRGFSVLFDDRQDTTTGVKFNDADLIGIPKQIIIGEKRIKNNEVEIKDRKTQEIKIISVDSLYDLL